MLGGQPHTLICGTQASDNALDGDIPFFTNENAFWHIMGDALGFRRGFHMRRSEAVDSIRPHLLHEEAAECSYEVARARVIDAGYAVWDVIAESERAGSLDQDIKKPRFHDIRGLCARHPTIERIAFATGQGSAKIFRAAWKRWLATPGAFRVAPDTASQAVFAKYVQPPSRGGDADSAAQAEVMREGGTCNSDSARPLATTTAAGTASKPAACTPIELLVMESVSPAAVPLVAARSHAKRVAAYTAAGRSDLVAAGAPRGAAYAWKRSCWLSSSVFPDAVLHEKAREARRFGAQPTDLIRDDEG